MSREDAVYILVALTVVGLCLFGDLNTRIGWTGAWSSGGWTAIGYMVMWFSLGVALVLMARSARTGEPCCLGPVLGLLIVAAIVLQWLPRSPSGVQFLPVSPWAFSAWVPFILSLISWLTVGLVFLALVYRDRAISFPVFLLLFLAANVLLSFWSLRTEPEPDPLSDYRRQIGEWSRRRDDAHRLLEALRRDRETLIERIKRLGVRSSADLRNVPAARPLAEELAEVIGQIRLQEMEAQRIDNVVFQAESHLRRIERRKVVGTTSKDEEERAIRVGLELSERLRSEGSDLMRLEVDEVLDKVLVGSEANQLQDAHGLDGQASVPRVSW